METGSQKFAVIEPKFHVVIAVRGNEDFFSIIGIFSKSDDANAMCDEVEADCPQWQGVSVTKMTMHSIRRHLVECELGQIKKLVAPLLREVWNSYEDQRTRRTAE